MRRRALSCLSVEEFFLVFGILSVLGAIVWPVLARISCPRPRTTCTSNQKMLVLGMLSYAQDYDGRFPPVVGAGGVTWAPANAFATNASGNAGLLIPYLKASPFWCPEASSRTGLTYLYNDLAATAQQGRDFAGPASTVLLAEGEDQPINAGHARFFGRPAADCSAVAPGGAGCEAGHGASVRGAPLRHVKAEEVGANYSFADGHVKWIKPGAVYFPPRASAARAHGPDEPDPAGHMTAKGHYYAGTFHLR